MTKEEQKRDKYYRKKYGITLADYDRMLSEQKECCAICDRHQSGFAKRLHVDHDHAWQKVKISINKSSSGLWDANACYRGVIFYAYSGKKNIANNLIKKDLKKNSVRGLLCWMDNTAIQKFRDNPERMEAAAQYLRRFQ